MYSTLSITWGIWHNRNVFIIIIITKDTGLTTIHLSSEPSPWSWPLNQQYQSFYKILWLQFHLWNSLSLSVWSPSTSYSSKTITIHIQHRNLCHPSCKHKNIWWKIFLLFWPICLEWFASNYSDSSSSFKASLKMHLFNNYFQTFSHPPPPPTPSDVCVCC